ncbi:MAG: hypothetical protein PHT49_12190 [Desulfovibrionales bacterium]|nr:hypothetical protein [Desulfovibrionales bacterium]
MKSQRQHSNSASPYAAIRSPIAKYATMMPLLGLFLARNQLDEKMDKSAENITAMINETSQNFRKCGMASFSNPTAAMLKFAPMNTAWIGKSSDDMACLDLMHLKQMQNHRRWLE